MPAIRSVTIARVSVIQQQIVAKADPEQAGTTIR
jgi:hypothetical protein